MLVKNKIYIIGDYNLIFNQDKDQRASNEKSLPALSLNQYAALSSLRAILKASRYEKFLSPKGMLYPAKACWVLYLENLKPMSLKAYATLNHNDKCKGYPLQWHSPGQSRLFQELIAVGKPEKGQILLEIDGVLSHVHNPIIEQSLVLKFEHVVRKTVVISIQVHIFVLHSFDVDTLHPSRCQLHIGEGGLNELQPIRLMDALVSVVVVHAEEDAFRVCGKLHA